jgi:hypothetical protein
MAIRRKKIRGEQMFTVGVIRGAYVCGCGNIRPHIQHWQTFCPDCGLGFTLWDEAAFDVDGVEMCASWQPAEPDVGIMHGYFEPQYAEWWDAEAKVERPFLLTTREEEDALDGEEPDDGSDEGYDRMREARWLEGE